MAGHIAGGVPFGAGEAAGMLFGVGVGEGTGPASESKGRHATAAVITQPLKIFSISLLILVDYACDQVLFLRDRIQEVDLVSADQRRIG